jgi:hypothetical protein
MSQGGVRNLDQLSAIIAISMLTGLTTVIIGLVYRLFPKQKGSRNMKITEKINNLALSRLLKSILKIIAGNETGFLYGAAARLLARSESSLSVHGLFLTKLASLILAAMLVTGIRYTNMEIAKQSIIARSSTAINIFTVQVLDYWSLLVIIFSFWLPEAILLTKRLMLASMYRKEVIKLENIFELLGSVRGIKTFDILMEMAKASNVYRKHLTLCMEQFKTDKEEAIKSLKSSVKSTRLAKLADVVRVFSMTDRKLALQILERHRFEQEEDMLITAEEDIDAVDLIAFISIVPVVWILINLLLKPMLDTIFEIFKYV